MAASQKIGYILVAALWLAAILLAILVPWPWLLLLILALHLVELLAIGLRTGRRAGHGDAWCIIMCMLFGFVWWLPIKQRLDPRA